MKILESLKRMPINGILIVLVSFLYFMNNALLKGAFTGTARYFFVCYFNDLICPLLFFSYVNILFLTVDKKITSLKMLLLFGFIVALIWEFFAPIINSESVTDIADVFCYIAGSIMYYIIIRACKYV